MIGVDKKNLERRHDISALKQLVSNNSENWEEGGRTNPYPLYYVFMYSQTRCVAESPGRLHIDFIFQLGETFLKTAIHSIYFHETRRIENKKFVCGEQIEHADTTFLS